MNSLIHQWRPRRREQIVVLFRKLELGSKLARNHYHNAEDQMMRSLAFETDSPSKQIKAMLCSWVRNSVHFLPFSGHGASKLGPGLIFQSPVVEICLSIFGTKRGVPRARGSLTTSTPQQPLLTDVTAALSIHYRLVEACVNCADRTLNLCEHRLHLASSMQSE